MVRLGPSNAFDWIRRSHSSLLGRTHHIMTAHDVVSLRRDFWLDSALEFLRSADKRLQEPLEGEQFAKMAHSLKTGGVHHVPCRRFDIWENLLNGSWLTKMAFLGSLQAPSCSLSRPYR